MQLFAPPSNKRLMRKLILVKHAPPEVLPDVPPAKWALSAKGRDACALLAERLASHAPAVIVSSEEPKAAETARLVAERLNVPWRTAPGLHEHDRSNVPHMRSGEFISMVELFFRRPRELVLGRETAEQARDRFEAAVQLVVDEQDEGNVAVVSHGTVIALMLEGRDSRGGFATWRAMGLPSFAVLSLPEMTLIQNADRL
jgi:broad specificity phosphatase PhoE